MTLAVSSPPRRPCLTMLSVLETSVAPATGGQNRSQSIQSALWPGSIDGPPYRSTITPIVVFAPSSHDRCYRQLLRALAVTMTVSLFTRRCFWRYLDFPTLSPWFWCAEKTLLEPSHQPPHAVPTLRPSRRRRSRNLPVFFAVALVNFYFYARNG